VSHNPQKVGEEEADWLTGWDSLKDARLSQPVFKKVLTERVPITTDDGVRLDARVIRPVTAPGVRVPIILQPSPYFAAELTAGQIAPELRQLHYVERGYALVGVALRGTGGSGGCVDYQGERDRADMNEVLDALAAQPWSSGRIGALGLSWDGTAVNSAIVTGNKHLAAAIPAESITDWYKWSFLDGVPVWFLGYLFNIYAPWTVAGAAFGASSHSLDHIAERVCADTPPSIYAQAESSATGVRDAWWDAHNLEPLAGHADPDLAVLQLAGYRDEGVRADHMTRWDRELRKRLRNYRLMIGDWGHLWPDTPNIKAARNDDLLFNPHPVTSWPVVMLRFWDRWLKDKPTGTEAMPPALSQDDDGVWHAQDALAPTSSARQRLYPTTDGRLAPDPSSGELSFVDNGLNVDPRGNCLYVALGFLIGCAPGQTGNAQFFLGAPLAERTRIAGFPTVHLQLRHSAPLGHVGVTLYRVRGAKWTPLTYDIASMNLADPYTFAPRQAGEVFDQTLTLLPRDATFRTGDRIAVAVGSQVGRNPMGLEGNGYLPVPSGGTTTIVLGSDTYVEVASIRDSNAISLR
jgi:putative CocE/NonD family hydrolase